MFQASFEVISVHVQGVVETKSSHITMIYMHNLIKKLPVREPHQMIYGNLVKPVRHLFYDSKLQLGLADIKKICCIL